MPTFGELVEEYLDQHVAESGTMQALRDRIKLAVEGIPVQPVRKGPDGKTVLDREYGFGHVRLRSHRRPDRRRVA